MKVIQTITIQRRNPNGSKESYHKSDRIAITMCSAAGSHVEHAGMAVQPAYGSRSKPAVGSREKRTRRKPQWISVWLPVLQAGHLDGYHVPHGTEGAVWRLHPVLCDGAQTQ